MTTEPKTVRELAREFVAAQDAYSAVYLSTLSTSLGAEARIDALLELDALGEKLGAARIALTAAQRRAA